LLGYVTKTGLRLIHEVGDVLMMDTTHGISSADVVLLTLAVKTKAEKGHLVASCFVRKESQEEVQPFLERLLRVYFAK